MRIFLCHATLFVSAAVTIFAQSGRQRSTSQDYVVKVWDARTGLAENSVTDVAQTPEGYLWIGTVFGSVVRFDGVRFESYSSANTPEFTWKWGRPNLFVDEGGPLWISVQDGGLATWDHHGFHLALDSETQPDRLLWSASNTVIFAYDNGDLLFGTQPNGQWIWKRTTPPDAVSQPQSAADAYGRVWYLRNRNQIGIIDGVISNTVSSISGIKDQKINLLTSDARRRIWIGTDQALAVWQTDHFEVMTPTNGEPVLNVRRVIPSGRDHLWVDANGRMRCCIDRKWTAESDGWNRELGQQASFNFLHGDREGGMWAGAYNSGLIHVAADGDFRRLTTQDGLPSDNIGFAYEDRDGNIWTGYERGGLVQVRQRLFHTIGQNEGLDDRLVNTVSEDSQGAVWMGTHSGLISRYENGTCTNLILPGSPPAEDVCTVADLQGGVWIGARKAGLWKFETGRARPVATQAELQSYPRQLLPTREGRLWVGTVWSIASIMNEKLTIDYTTQSVGGHPTSLAETTDGTIWAGTLSGMLLRWDGRQFLPVEPPEKGSLGRIWALCAGPDGSLWAGTEAGGLLHWSQGKFFRYTTQNGLPSDCIAQILIDTGRNLWLGTRAGIIRVSCDAFFNAEHDDLHELPISTYGQTDGLLTLGSAMIYQPNCWCGHDGKLFFATDNGVYEVDPAQAHINTKPPVVALEEFWADGKRILPTRAGAIRTSAGKISPTPTMNVGPGRNDLEFHYTGLSLSSPSAVRFKYKLEGLENTWNDASTERKAIYRHLPPGRYVFRLIACNRDSVWSAEGALLDVTVNPFFYQTLWFRSGTVLLLLAVLFSGVALAIWRWKDKLQRRHELERERSRIAQDLHDDLGAGLTEIGLLGGLLQDPDEFSTSKQDALDRIVQRCHDLVAALDEIVWAVNPRNDSFNSLGSYLCRYAQRFLEPSGIRCRLELSEVEPDHPLNSEQRHDLFLSFKEVLTNIVKHSGAGEVRIAISVVKTCCLIAVEDNGHGLPSSMEPGGEGLGNLHRRMARIGGHCKIANSPGNGVTVHLSLPFDAR